jgi:hypothetical protein
MTSVTIFSGFRRALASMQKAVSGPIVGGLLIVFLIAIGWGADLAAVAERWRGREFEYVLRRSIWVFLLLGLIVGLFNCRTKGKLSWHSWWSRACVFLALATGHLWCSWVISELRIQVPPVHSAINRAYLAVNQRPLLALACFACGVFLTTAVHYFRDFVDREREQTSVHSDGGM